MNRHAFTSRTQKSIRQIDGQALSARMKGITHTKEGINVLSIRGNRDMARELIASMNYSVNQCRKELAFRNKK